MIPILFKKDEKQFRTYGIGELSDFTLSPEVRRERNGLYTFYMEYAPDGVLADKLDEGMKIKSDAGVRTKWQTFEINRIVKRSGENIQVYANHISMRTAKDVIKPKVSGSNLDGQGLLRLWANNLVGDDQWDVWSDVSTQVSVNWSIEDFDNAREVLGGREGSILDRVGGEFEFDNQMIRLHKEMGRNAPIVLEYGRNIISIEKEDQNESKFTAIYPFATFTPENRDTNQIVSLPEYYIDSKYAGMYDHRKIQLVDFTTEFDNDNKPTVAKVRELAKKYIESNEVGAPHTNIKVEYVDLAKTLDYEQFEYMEEVELNDRLPIYYPKFDITNNQAKAVVIVYDPVKEENKSIELGVIGQRFGHVLTGNTPERLNKIEKEQKNQMLYVVNAAGNRIWYSTPPDNIEHKIGDTWFDKNGPYMLLKVWNGSQWIVEINTEDVDKVKKEVEKAQQGLEEYKNQIDASIEELNTTIGNTFTSLDDTINQLSSISEQTRLNAEAAQAQSLTALSDAQKARENATDALTAARQGLSALEGVESSISSIDYEIDELNGSLSLKANQTDMNKLTGKVEQHTFDISVNAEGLKAKANQSTVDTLSGRVTTLSGELTVQAGLLQSKIGMTEVSGAIDGIQIGGRNLARDTHSEYRFLSDQFNGNDNQTFYMKNVYTEGLVAGDFISFRVFFKYENFVAVSGMTPRVRFQGNGNITNWNPGMPSSGSPNLILTGSGEQIFEWTSRVTEDQLRNDYWRFQVRVDYIQSGSMRTKMLKVNRGTKPEDWTPAPEDIQGQFKSMETDIEQTASAIKLKANQSTVDTLSGRVSTLNSQLTIQADQINGKVSMTDVDSAIGKLDINDRNLTKNTSSKLRTATFSGWDFYFDRYYEVRTGEEFTARIWVEPQVHDVRVMLEFGPSNSNSYYKQAAGNIIKSGEKGYAVVTANATNNGWVRQSIRHVTNQSTQNRVGYKDVKMQRGSKATDWTPAFEDVDAQISHVESEFTQKADSITGTVSTLSGEVGTLKLTANGLTTSVKDAEGNIQTLQTNVNGLQSTVANKTDRSDFTQLANGFSLLSQNFNELEIGQSNFLLNTTDERTFEGQGISNQTGGNQNYVFDVPSRQLKDLPLVVGDKWVFSFNWEIRANNPQGQFTVQFNNQPYGSGMSRVNLSGTNRSGHIQHVMTANDAWTASTATALGFRLDNVPPGHRLIIKNFIFSKGTISPGWTPALSEVASQAQLTLLSDQINLRVKEGDLMSQINLEAGRTLIQTDKLYLDSSSVVFSGKAFIPDAAITSMTADKITAGVIDADKITVINLDANRMTSGTINGANSSWNLNTGRMEFTNPDNGNTLQFTQGDITFRRGIQERRLEYSSEGLIINPGRNNTGTGLNASIQLNGGGASSYKYLQFGDTTGKVLRVQAIDNHIDLMPSEGGRVRVMTFGGGGSYASLEALMFYTNHPSGNSIRYIENRIETPRDGDREIIISPQGNAGVRVRNAAGSYYPVYAANFVNSSSRKLKTNIIDFNGDALGVINSLKVVQYNLISDLENGVHHRQIGLIAEDSPSVSSVDGSGIENYKAISYLIKSVQEISTLQTTLETKIDNKLFNYDSKIFQLEAKVTDLEQQIKELKGAA